MKVITIGRGSDNNVTIQDASVSRHHCQIWKYDDDTFTITDLASKNGTFVNGRRIHGRVSIGTGDTVKVGNVAVSWIDYFNPLPPPTTIVPAPPPKNKWFPIVMGSVAGIALIAILLVVLLRGKSSDGDIIQQGQVAVENANIFKVDNSGNNGEKPVTILTDNVVSNKKETPARDGYKYKGCLKYRLLKNSMTDDEQLVLKNTCNESIRVKGYLVNSIVPRGGDNRLDFEEIIGAGETKHVVGFVENKCVITSVEKLGW